MLKYLNRTYIFIIFVVSFSENTIYSQVESVNIAVQQGHAKDIEFVAVSKDLKYFATFGLDKRLVIWDYRTGSQMAFRYLNIPLKAMDFGATSNILFLKYVNGNVGSKLDIESMTITFDAVSSVVFKEKFQSESTNYSVQLIGAKIILTNKKTGKSRKKTADYFDQPFNSVVMSADEKLIFAACEDGLIYVFNSNLKLIDQYHGHNSGATDICLTKDNRYLFSVSKDRSIIKWDLRTDKQIARFVGNSFPIYGLSLNANASSILFGDDVGFVKQLNINDNKIDIQSDRKSLHPILFTYQISDSIQLYSGKDNGLYYNCLKKECGSIYSIKYNPKRLSEFIFTKGFDYYRSPYSVFHSYSISPSKKLLAISTEFTTKNPEYSKIIDFSDVNSLKESPRLFPIGQINIPVVCFLNDSTLVGTYTDQSIVFWKTSINNLKEVYSKTVSAPSSISHLSRLNDSILIAGNNKTLFFYNERIGWFDKLELESIKSIHTLDENLFAVVDGNESFFVLSSMNGVIQKSEPFSGHLDSITSIKFNQGRNLIFSTSMDGMIIVWDKEQVQKKVTFIPIGSQDFVCLTPDNFYMTSGKNMKSFGFKLGARFIYPEQFDPYYNRPDIVLQRLGYHDTTLIQAYHNAYLKRLKKLGFSEQTIKADFDLPEISIRNIDTIPSSTNQSSIMMHLDMNEEKFLLDRFNIWVNGVPILGMNGVSLKRKNTNHFDTLITINFSDGVNKIQISCTNTNGAESFDETVLINYIPVKVSGNKTYFIGIGIDQFKETGHNLDYSVKDIRDLSKALDNKLGKQLIIDTLFNENVLVENIEKLKQRLLNSSINDKIIVAYSGHGLLSKEFDYFLSSYNVNFQQPENGGIPYELLADLLDSIPARKKLMLIDACHSGEVDKDELIATNESSKEGEKDGKYKVKMRLGKVGLKNSFQLMQELFVDVEKGSGATVISAAGGDQSALEDGVLKNGYFTYAILQLLNSKESVTVNELKAHVLKEVLILSKGKQKPTSRVENLEVDWKVW